mgnify:CR=1 FL=1
MKEISEKMVKLKEKKCGKSQKDIAKLFDWNTYKYPCLLEFQDTN